MENEKATLPETAYKWALPGEVRDEVPPDKLVVRLDCYSETIVLSVVNERGFIDTRVVAGNDITHAFLQEVPLDSGLLPPDTLWWKQSRNGIEVALWQPAKVWPVALEWSLSKPARRFKIPMPGLIFVCWPGKGPKIFAAKRRPRFGTESIYHAPTLNTSDDGSTCEGTNQYPTDITKIPESFFTSFFSHTTGSNSSQKYGADTLKLWEELDGTAPIPAR